MQFTTNWFDPHMSAWKSIVPIYKPSTYLEIGSFEDRSTCHLIGTMGDAGALDVHCIDTWQGGEEHSDINMGGWSAGSTTKFRDASTRRRTP